MHPCHVANAGFGAVPQSCLTGCDEQLLACGERVLTCGLLVVLEVEARCGFRDFSW